MIDICRLGHTTLATGELDRQVDHYTNIIGLAVTERSERRAVLATREGGETLVLERAHPTSALLGLSFQIAPDANLAALAQQLRVAGVACDQVSDPTPCVSQAIRLLDPAGTTIDLFADTRFADVPRASIGIMPLKLGHVARLVAEASKCAAFYTEILGFRISDWRNDVAYFLRCGPDHHTINLFYGARPGLAHVAFEVKDGAELHRASDILAARGCKLDWGPSRHNIGHNISSYHADADGNRVELYCEMDQMKSEALGYFEPRPWHADRPQRPKAWPLDTSKNYWGSWGT